MTTATPDAGTGLRAAQLDRVTAMRLAAAEYLRYLGLLRGLSDADWARPTDCPDWDVRAMATHVLGMAEMSASVRENIRQNRAARRQGGPYIDALTGLQVAERTRLRPAEVVSRLARVAPLAARGRRRTPGLLRRRAMPVPQQVGDAEERWTIGYLIDVILTRDTWMHRIDTARATGTPLRLTPDHDGVIVADVVREWAGRHGQPYALTLTGPAGGTWSAARDGQGEAARPVLTLDAVEFCRALSGRRPAVDTTGRRPAADTAPASELLTVPVPF
jgi:uncharacterized protein (TIGR03083 family)